MAKFKVLLLYPNLQMVNLLPSNIAVLSACLKQAGFEVKLFDTTLYRTTDKSVDDIRVEHMQLRPFNLKEKGVDYKQTDIFSDFSGLVSAYKPDLIGMSATDDTYELGMELISGVRDFSKAHVIIGGIYPKFSPDATLTHPAVDSICIGDGEKSLAELCRKIAEGKDITAIRNLWVKKEGKVFKNKPELSDINSLPYDDFSVFEDVRFFRPMQGKIFRMVPVMLDRGCPFQCSFCAAPSLKKFYQDSGAGEYFRVKTVDRIMDEIKHYVAVYKADYIYFNTETFFARPDKELELFFKRYIAEVGLPFWCQTRIETVTDARAKILKDMNCDRISIGLEHGNEDFRKKMLKKNFTNKQAVEAFEILHKNKIAVTVNNMIGFPDETRELAFDTIKLNRQIKADSINAYFFVPYSGTPLRDYCLEKGYFSSDVKTDSLMKRSVLGMPQFTPDQIKGLVRTFPLYIKMPESYFPRIRQAEELTEVGDKILTELRALYFEGYFK